MAPIFESIPVNTFNPNPAPAMLPILKTSPPNAINAARKKPSPGNTLFAMS